jgi:hypothetical protein
MGYNVHTIVKNPDAILATSKETVVDMNDYKTKYIVMYLHQNTVRRKFVKTDDSTFESLEELFNVGTT